MEKLEKTIQKRATLTNKSNCSTNELDKQTNSINDTNRKRNSEKSIKESCLEHIKKLAVKYIKSFCETELNEKQLAEI